MATEALRAAGRPLGGFWHWWTGELAGLIPGRSEVRHRLTKPHLLLTIETEVAVLTACERAGDVEIGRSEDVENALDLLTHRRQRRLPIVIRLAKALGLRKTVDLPGAARFDLDRVLFFELDRLTPFHANDVCYASRIVEDDRRGGRIKVQVDLAPKGLIEHTLQAIRERKGRLIRIELDGEANGTALDLTPKSPIDSKPVGRWRRLLPAIVVGLAIFAVAIPLRQQSIALHQLDSEMARARMAADESVLLRDQLQQFADRSGFLIARKNHYLPRTNVMAALTRLIPDQAFVSRLQIKDGEIVLVGHADRASELLGSLERSPLFKTPRFQSPLTRDPRTGKERFQIAVGLAWTAP
jgi:general secretion pathway protein L